MTTEDHRGFDDVAHVVHFALFRMEPCRFPVVAFTNPPDFIANRGEAMVIELSGAV